MSLEKYFCCFETFRYGYRHLPYLHGHSIRLVFLLQNQASQGVQMSPFLAMLESQSNDDSSVCKLSSVA